MSIQKGKMIGARPGTNQNARTGTNHLATALVYDQADRFIFGTNLKALENMFNLY